MKIEMNYIKSLTDTELIKEWKKRGYESFWRKVGKVSGLGWDSMDAAINYSNYHNEMKERELL